MGTCGFAFVSFLAIVFSMFKANIANAYVEPSVKHPSFRITEISQIHPGNVYFDLSAINSLIEDGEEVDELDDESEDDSYFHSFIDFIPCTPLEAVIQHEITKVELVVQNSSVGVVFAVPRFIQFRNIRI